MSLTWKSNFSGTEYRIFRGKVIAGLLKTSSWKSAGYGELDGHLMRFKTTGFFQKSTEIKSIEGERTLGGIEFHFMKTAATILYDGEQYEWQFMPWSRRKWSVTHKGSCAAFRLSGFWQNVGEIENDHIPAPVLLAALYIYFHYRKFLATF